VHIIWTGPSPPWTNPHHSVWLHFRCGYASITPVTGTLARTRRLWQQRWRNYSSNVQACSGVIEAWWWSRPTSHTTHDDFSDSTHRSRVSETPGHERPEIGVAKCRRNDTSLRPEPISKMFAARAAGTSTARWFIDISVVRPTNSISGLPWRHVLFIESAPTGKVHDDQHSDPTWSPAFVQLCLLESQ